jgi:hypothetical protein
MDKSRPKAGENPTAWQKACLHFLNGLDGTFLLNSVLHESTTRKRRLKGWCEVANLTCSQSAGGILDVSVRYAWGQQVFRQSLVDHVGDSPPLFRKRRRSEHDRRKLIVYLCEASTGLDQRQCSFEVPRKLILGNHWSAVLHYYVLLPTPHPFSIPGHGETANLRLELSDSSSGKLSGPPMEAVSPPMNLSGNSDPLSYNARTEGGLRKKGSFRQTAESRPLISVVTVVLNGEKYLEQTIQSVVNQPYENLEYLVIDGGSNDGTLDILRQYGDVLDYWLSEPDQGIYHAMNKGWNLSRGEFVHYLGADDTLIELPVRALVEAQARGLDIVYGDVLLSNGHRFVSRYGFTLRFNNTLHHQGLFLRRSLFDLSPFNQDLKVFSDFDLNQRLKKSKRVALKTDCLVAFFRLTRGRDACNCREFFQTIRRNFGIPTMVCAYIYLRMRGLAFRLQGRKS